MLLVDDKKARSCILIICRYVHFAKTEKGLRQKSGFSSGSLFPILLEAIGLNKASQRRNGICATDGPFHTGVLHTLANDRPARRFNDSRANE